MKHTPGPWEGRYVPSGMPTDCVKFGVIGPDGLEVARVWRQEDVPTISAAPGLLEALRKMERLVTELYPGDVEPDPEHLGEYEAVWTAVMDSRAAIAKAENR